MSEDKNTQENRIDNNIDHSEKEASTLNDVKEFTNTSEENVSESTVTMKSNENATSETDATENPISKDNISDDNFTKDNISKDNISKDQLSEDMKAFEAETKKKRIRRIKALRLLLTAGFLLFAGLFVNEMWIEPYRANIAIEKARELYQRPEPTTPVTDITPTIIAKDTAAENSSEKLTEEPTPTPDPNRDEKGRLLQFKELLETNEDVKGWVKIDNIVTGENDTKIDYVVMQNVEDPEYYLSRRWNDKKKVKKGSLFLDYKSSVENNTQNLVIHGHNMTSTDDMFHYLLKYNDLKYYKEHPIISFDTIFQTGEWKIFSIFITNGSSDKEELFNFTKSEFDTSSDFLNFIYQVRIRSLYNADSIDINENDQILTLSTCSYEVKNYRTVIVARKVREGEDASVDVDSIVENPEPLFPESYYYRYGGKAPKLSASFETAFEDGKISWYNPIGK